MAVHNELKITGLTELRAALRQLPADLAREAGAIVMGHAEAAASHMAPGYAAHVYTGTLAGSLSVTKEEAYARFGARAVVRNTAPHAHWAEKGTTVRTTTKTKANRGAMRALKIFIPPAQRSRELMVHALMALVERAGFKVSGA